MPSKESNFAFIADAVLRSNLDRTFDHIVELVSLSESPKYDELLKSSFRKTTIIFTASIVEALLLFILKKQKTEKECAQLRTSFKVLKELYRIDERKRIVLGEDRHEREKFSFNKLNLDQINKLCRDHKIIADTLYKNIDNVRILRNRQHLGGLDQVDQDYTAKDLEFVFSVAREIKLLVEHVSITGT